MKCCINSDIVSSDGVEIRKGVLVLCLFFVYYIREYRFKLVVVREGSEFGK